ncbi:MAG TPA: lamin tail domain-containing protein, partial [Thermoanaerobaculia bacterium]|nr:lamin tail domain-containing protein [Thermoanaerobaculia bacterium]
RPGGGPPLRIYFPDVEQGSSTLIVSPTGSAMLIDGGSEIRAADDDVVRFVADLQAAGVVASLDYVVATHYDEDHIGHLEDVLAHGLLAATGTVYDRGTAYQVPSSFAYSDYAWQAGLHDRTTIAPGQVISLGGGVTVTCLVANGEVDGGPTVDLTGTEQLENGASVGLLVEYGDFDLWIAGDLTGNAAELGVGAVEAAVASRIGDVEVYVVHHHGSRTSSTAGFLAAIEAEVAINQNSADNDFGHPNETVVQAFLATPDSCDQTPLFVQQNPGNSTDERSDDTLAAGIADPDDVDAVLGLAGTILLVSDGTDYQVSGGDVTPFTLPADCTGTATADFPPTVVDVTRSPWVPTASQSVAVEAEVRDEGSATVTLEWTLDGVAQTPIAMSRVGSTAIWTGTIPAQTNGSRVAYVVEAEDAASQTAASRPQGYFSGTAPVAALRVDAADGSLTTAEYAARVAGTVTVEPGIFHPFVSQVFLQDAAGDGIQVFDSELLSIGRGDEVVFVGELEQFSGMTELATNQAFGGYGHSVTSSGTPPAPLAATVAQIGEALEGVLVELTGLTVVDGSIPGPGEGNGFLTVSADGGLTTATVKIDGDTDVPGAPTPLGAFDVVGVVVQSDAWPDFDDGYQVVPRERADFDSAEVNLPAVVIHEIHADPHSSQGDANGDGTVSSFHDEFVELANTTWAEIDLSGWTLSDAVGVRHVFANGTVLPPREAVVVFSGGSPSGAFGNAGAAGLVFTASTGQLGLNNTGDTLTLADDASATVQSVTYGSSAGNDQSLTRSPDLTNAPIVGHVAASATGARYSPGTWASDGGAFTVPPGAVLLSEVMYDPTSTDAGLEWVELVNVSGAAIDLSKRPISLGWGGSDYTGGTLTLDSGTLSPCDPFVVGGPTSSADNASPTFDLAVEFVPGIQNSGTTADGLALFNRPGAFVTAATVPADAVRYGTSNDNCLVDETGACSAPDVGDAGSGQTIERTTESGTWQVQTTPTPGASPLTTGGSCGGGGGPTCLEAGDLVAGDLLLSEVLYDVSGSDGGFEWIELYNDSGQEICLDGLSLGWGGSDYTYGGLDLTGTVAAGETFVVGGTSSTNANGHPNYDQETDLSPDLQNGGSTADGVALFTLPAASIGSSTVPYDAVIYGTSNGSCLLDASGSCGAVDVGSASAGSSIERTTVGGGWQTQGSPSPGSSPLP